GAGGHDRNRRGSAERLGNDQVTFWIEGESEIGWLVGPLVLHDGRSSRLAVDQREYPDGVRTFHGDYQLRAVGGVANLARGTREGGGIHAAEEAGRGEAAGIAIQEEARCGTWIDGLMGASNANELAVGLDVESGDVGLDAANWIESRAARIQNVKMVLADGDAVGIEAIR